MIEETYLKECRDEGDAFVISFEGNRKDIYRLRDYANVINREIDSDIKCADENTEKDMVNHPSHYTDSNGMECIDEMLLVFGKEATMHFCLLNCWKYRHRAVYKNGVEDKLKSDWYMAKYKELKEQIAKESKNIATTITCSC